MLQHTWSSNFTFYATNWDKMSVKNKKLMKTLFVFPNRVITLPRFAVSFNSHFKQKYHSLF